jgi:hypothetical protein
MRRRDLIKSIVCAATAWPLAARAQGPVLPVVGALTRCVLRAVTTKKLPAEMAPLQTRS